MARLRSMFVGVSDKYAIESLMKQRIIKDERVK
jgi:hypothetical protein